MENRARRRRMHRVWTTVVLAGMAIAGGGLIANGAMAAAGGGGGGPKGNNGFVKIHDPAQDIDADGDGVPDPDPSNRPHVSCQFDIVFFNYDGSQQVTADIETWSPSTPKNVNVFSQGLTLENDGPAPGANGANDFDGLIHVDLTNALAGITPGPGGQYHLKLFVHAPGSAQSDNKHKVFWVGNCAPNPAIPTGGLTVTKNAPADPASQATVFTFHIDCGADGTFTRTVTGSGVSTAITGLPTTAACTVSEDTVPGFVAQPSQPAPAIQANQNVNVTFNNVLTPPNTGNLTVTKDAPNDATSQATVFTFHIDCGAAGTFTRTVTGDGVSSAVTGIPDGTSCTISEDTAAGFVPQGNQQTNVVAGQTANVTFVNALAAAPTGALTVTKDAPNDVAAQATVFTFHIDCGAAGTFTRTVTGDGVSAAVSGLPVGITCSVSEDTVAGYVAQASQTSPAIVAGQSVNVTFVNQRAAGPAGCVGACPPPPCQVNCGPVDPGDPGDPGDPPVVTPPVVTPDVPQVTPPEVGPTQQVENPEPTPAPAVQPATVVLGETIEKPSVAPQVLAEELPRTGFAHVREMVFGGALLVLVGLVMLAEERRSRPLEVWRRGRVQ